MSSCSRNFYKNKKINFNEFKRQWMPQLFKIFTRNESNEKSTKKIPKKRRWKQITTSQQQKWRNKKNTAELGIKRWKELNSDNWKRIGAQLELKLSRQTFFIEFFFIQQWLCVYVQHHISCVNCIVFFFFFFPGLIELARPLSMARTVFQCAKHSKWN